MVDAQYMFFELETQVHKSAKGADSKSKLLPLVCPCVGVDGKDWVSKYLALRVKPGLDMPGSQDACMLPGPSGSENELWASVVFPRSVVTRDEVVCAFAFRNPVWAICS